MRDCLRDHIYDFGNGARVLILIGIHGNSDGTIGEKDEDLTESFTGVIEKFCSEEETTISEQVRSH